MHTAVFMMALLLLVSLQPATAAGRLFLATDSEEEFGRGIKGAKRGQDLTYPHNYYWYINA